MKRFAFALCALLLAVQLLPAEAAKTETSRPKEVPPPGFMDCDQWIRKYYKPKAGVQGPMWQPLLVKTKKGGGLWCSKARK